MSMLKYTLSGKCEYKILCDCESTGAMPTSENKFLERKQLLRHIDYCLCRYFALKQ